VPFEKEEAVRVFGRIRGKKRLAMKEQKQCIV
jgi:hypothetical protein